MIIYTVECTYTNSGNRCVLTGEYKTRNEAEARKLEAQKKAMFQGCLLEIVHEEISN